MDDIKYSRQRYVLGSEAQRSLSRSSVYIHGFGVLGVEIAKNLILTGVEKLTIHDCKIATPSDLSFNFFLDRNAVSNDDNRVLGSLKEMREMNPNVDIKVITDQVSDWTFVKQFQCVILTEMLFNDQIIINELCRQSNPSIKFISADCFGILSYCFTDFGDKHEVFDVDGEQHESRHISSLLKNDDVVIVVVEENMRHNLEVGDSVIFHNLSQFPCLNNLPHKVTSTTLNSFQVEHPHDDCHLHNSRACGMFKKSKKRLTIVSESLEKQLRHPTFIEAKDSINVTYICHCALLALHSYLLKFGSLPLVENVFDQKKFFDLVHEMIFQNNYQNFDISCYAELLNTICRCASGIFHPLAAFMGGVTAQEVLKGVTNKYIPINQWFNFNAADVVQEKSNSNRSSADLVNICLGDELSNLLKSVKVFMVGCGAIGCEMLKNLALLKIGSENSITITDNDLVEKSNLSRQFLFRNRNLQMSKSVAAAESVKRFCPDVKIQPLNCKVNSDSGMFFNDAFFQDKDIIIAALDNIEGRRYLDRRCVDNCLPLLESGTFGTKGHVQVIVPHFTESYSSQSDPVDEEVPYCTLKSFPTSINHTIQWARDKFEKQFYQIPIMIQKFETSRSTLESNVKNSGDCLGDEYLKSISSLIGWLKKATKCRPKCWVHCLHMARFKFEKFFNHNAKQLMYKIPLETKRENGEPFWNNSRLPPTPISFDNRDPTHLAFISSYAKLLAISWGIQVDNVTDKFLIETIESLNIPDFVPDNTKKVEIDFELKVEDIRKAEDPEMDAKTSMEFLNLALQQDFSQVKPQEFDKDDEVMGHLDFITSTANLRAVMYGIEPVPKDSIRQIAGRIIPAIITTTSAIAGLLTIELVKLVQKSSRETHQNCFLNLALSSFIFAEPAPAPVQTLRSGHRFTLWDKWNLQGHKNFTLQDFINAVKDKYGITVDTVIQGTKIVFMSFIPMYNTKMEQKMTKLLDLSNGITEVDLIVDVNDDGEKSFPPIRYYTQ